MTSCRISWVSESALSQLEDKDILSLSPTFEFKCMEYVCINTNVSFGNQAALIPYYQQKFTFMNENDSHMVTRMLESVPEILCKSHFSKNPFASSESLFIS
ncbi:hypothetical protein NQ315_000741 [Exocentrus adspersus]|uniref:Uncharacterized protein n=1 Tax=Exocentrus adspersus TaxID=1586481 RepID=A0AAV8WEA1_9CUCU|nr:hypothetical protein NQ315_000741 [Exocentrus adspersus]